MQQELQKINILSRADLDISYYIGPGHGGQNKQKNSTGVLIIHKASMAQGRCHDTRSQAKNRTEAFRRLTAHPRMKVWVARKVYEIRNGESMEEVVERMMAPENLKIETY